MHTILCYGDSNTFGTNPSGGRWPLLVRWTGRLKEQLGHDFHVIEEGLGGRTTVFDDPFESMRNGKTYLPVALQSHRPIDLVVLSLGTNDCKRFFCANEMIIAKGLETLALMVKNHSYGAGYPTPQVLVISPIVIGEEIEHSSFVSFDSASVTLSKKLASSIEEMARKNNFLFFDAASVAKPSEIDQLHMDSESHQALAQALEQVIRNWFDLPLKQISTSPEIKDVLRPKLFNFLKR